MSDAVIKIENQIIAVNVRGGEGPAADTTELNAAVAAAAGSVTEAGAQAAAAAASAAAIVAQYALLGAIEYSRSGYAEVLTDEDFRILEGTTSAGVAYLDGVRVSTISTDLYTALAGKATIAQGAKADTAVQPLDIGLYSSALEYERSGYADIVADEDFRLLEWTALDGNRYVEGVRVSTAASAVSSTIGLYENPREFERSGYIELLFDEDFRILEGTTTAGARYVEGVRVSLAGIPEAPLDGRTYGRASAGWSPVAGAARAPYILFAAFDAPDYIKGMADYICSGVDDNIIIQSVMDNLPIIPPRIITGCLVTGARGGHLRFSEGTFNCSTELTFPSGSVIHFHGSGLSADRYDRIVGENSTNTGTPRADGGTVFYFTSPSGRGLYWPKGVWPRVDDPSVTNEVPVSGVYVEGFHLYLKNPAVSSGVAAVDCIGMACGRVKDVYSIGLPRSPAGGHKATFGFAFRGGARSDNKDIIHCVASGFASAGFITDTTHIHLDRCSAHTIGGGSDPCGFSIKPDNGVSMGYLHCFGSGNGIRTTGSGQLHVEHADFEAINLAVILADPTTPIHFSHVSSEQADTVWVGDLADYCIVDSAYRIGGAVRSTGTIVVPAGQTTATGVLAMCGTPRRPPLLIPNSSGGVGAWGTATKTAITVNLPATSSTDTTLSYEVCCA